MTAIRVGIGGWTYPPWRGPFYPPGLPHAQELAAASATVTAIEINATFYGRQKPASFAKWRDATPPGFVFTVKASRGATHRRDLADGAPTIAGFLDSGITELGDKLGPILWQFPPTQTFEPDAIAGFLDRLPPTHAGHTLRHAVEVRHASFADPAYVALLRERRIAHAVVDSDRHALFADMTADFAYVRLQRNSLAAPEGYATPALDAWATRLRGWATGAAAADLPLAGPTVAEQATRDVFAFFISGDKVRAPDSARAMLGRLATRG